MPQSPRGAWTLAGVVAGAAGLATSYLTASVLSIREAPVTAVADLVIRLTPGPVVEFAIGLLGTLDKPLLVVGILVVLALLFGWCGRLARGRWWAPAVVFALLAVVGLVAVLGRSGTTTADAIPVAVGFVTWVISLSLLTGPLRRLEELDDEQAAPPAPAALVEGERTPVATQRRGFLIGIGSVLGVSAVLGVAGRFLGAGRRRVEETRRLLRLSSVTEPAVPGGARVGVPGVAPWMTPTDDFYLIDTAIVRPAIDPAAWTLRIHGLVDRELTISYADLLAREVTQRWVTLNCVSNEVGGELVGNAWWSGARVADILAEVGVDPEADCVLQTSDDGWTCSTPLSALLDGDREALLAVAMNGRPLPIDHGFPVRTIVPGLYGYVSACKWVVDWEVTRYEDVTAYWTERGWGVMGPVKIASRIDVPRSGEEVAAGTVVLGGAAWFQHTGISAVEVSVDGGSWQPASLGEAPNDDTWVQWRAEVDVEPGDHEVRVRATGADGEVQTSVERDVLPDGATGLHTIGFTAT